MSEDNGTKEKAGTNLFRLLETDPELEEGGAWFDFPGTQSRFRIRSDASRTVEVYRQRLTQERVEQLRQGGEPMREALAEIAELVISDALLTGWEGVLGENDEPLEFTQDNARLLTKRVRRVAGFIEQRAGATRPFLVRRDAVTAGN